MSGQTSKSSSHEPTPGAPAIGSRWVGVLVLAAVALFAIVPAVPKAEDPPDVVTVEIDTELRVFLEQGGVGVRRQISSPATVPNGAVLSFEYSLGVDAKVVLLAQEGDDPEVAWTSSEVLPPGVYEVGAGDDTFAWTVDKPVSFALETGEGKWAWFAVGLAK